MLDHRRTFHKIQNKGEIIYTEKEETFNQRSYLKDTSRNCLRRRCRTKRIINWNNELKGLIFDLTIISYLHMIYLLVCSSFFLSFSLPLFSLLFPFSLILPFFDFLFFSFLLLPLLIHYFTCWFYLFNIIVLNSHVTYFWIGTLIYWLNGYAFLCIYNFPLVLYFMKNPSVGY